MKYSLAVKIKAHLQMNKVKSGEIQGSGLC